MQKKSKYIKFMIPIYASAEFRCKEPEGWSEMSIEDQASYFIDNCQITDRLCHQCSGHIESDFDMADHAEQFLVDEWMYDAQNPIPDEEEV